MKNIRTIIYTAVALVYISMMIVSCTASRAVISEKSGAQLWGENCIRCHNSPSPVDFKDDEWKTIGLHMQVRANLTSEETKKIIDFLCSAN